MRDPNKPAHETFQADRAAAELAAAVMDMTGEDQDSMAAQRRQWQWDKRKKKYVQVAGGDPKSGQGSKRIRTESGKAIDSSKVRGRLCLMSAHAGDYAPLHCGQGGKPVLMSVQKGL